MLVCPFKAARHLYPRRGASCPKMLGLELTHRWVAAEGCARRGRSNSPAPSASTGCSTAPSSTREPEVDGKYRHRTHGLAGLTGWLELPLPCALKRGLLKPVGGFEYLSFAHVTVCVDNS